ncbi:spore germination protein [Clostridium ganghwense]|uniref:Spore germination protein n=1 Tax=Clostridium ganghwense TaxID=312089 RepID=A0ABT4CMJ3_9CLOT|nr:spore germination protein [Clostridium ganghwense]MCY6370158.1 spore germination protein [Clostridium ganghwense]
MEKSLLTKNFKNNIDLISSKIPSNSNFIIRDLILKGNIKCVILYINGLSNQEYIERGIIYPLLFKIDEELDNRENICSYLTQRYISCYDCKITQNINDICYSLKHGKCIILTENNDSCIICNTIGGSYRSITESTIETDIRGGKESFVESLEINIALIQQKLKNKNFKMESFIIGDESETDVVLMYVENIIDPKVLNNIREKLKSIKAPYIPDVGYLSQHMEEYTFCSFAETKVTEKPGKAISDMLQGKAVIMLNGSPQVIILPAVFIEFFQAFEDYSNRLVLGNFDRLLRIAAIIIVLLLSPVYLTLLEYNVRFLPLPLIKVLINSRLGIPLSPFLEVLSMELIIEFLREGGIRLPTPIGQTLGIVGGIVLGEAATKAGIVSYVTLVVVAVGVISTFVIPNYEMSITIRFLRFPLIILAKLFGFFGIISGLYIIFLSIVSKDSFGIPYFSPFAPLRSSGLRDTILRAPLKNLNSKPKIFKFTKNKEKKNE